VSAHIARTPNALPSDEKGREDKEEHVLLTHDVNRERKHGLQILKRLIGSEYELRAIIYISEVEKKRK
jgi:hypothetical protein